MKPLFAVVCVALIFLRTDLLAETKPTVLVCNLPAVYDGSRAVARRIQTIKEKQKKAQQELDIINTQGKALVVEYKKALEAANHAPDAEKKAATAEAQRLLDLVMKKDEEVKAYMAATYAALQKEVDDLRTEALARILTLYRDYAKTCGAISVHDSDSNNVGKLPPVPKHVKKIECTKELIAYVDAHESAEPAVPPAK